jgi:hypothetical protein
MIINSTLLRSKKGEVRIEVRTKRTRGSRGGFLEA